MGPAGSVCCFPSRNRLNTGGSNSQLILKIQSKPILKDGFCSKVHSHRENPSPYADRSYFVYRLIFELGGNLYLWSSLL
jgi:hypothetical protein